MPGASSGWYLILQGNFAKAQQALERAHQFDPENYAWTARLGHIGFLRGERSAARQWYEKTARLIPEREALYEGPLAELDLLSQRRRQLEALQAERAWLEDAVAFALENRRLRWELDRKRAQDYPDNAHALEFNATHLSIATYPDHRWRSHFHTIAESLFREALALHQAAESEGLAHIPSVLNSLAAFLEYTERNTEADRLYREALAIHRSSVFDGDPAIAVSLTGLAGWLLAMVRYAKAEPLYHMGHDAEAESLFREALAIETAALPEGHPSIATGLSNLASLLLGTELLAEAESLYHQALRIAQVSADPTLLWNVQSGLSDLYAVWEQRPLAIFFGKQAVNTLQAVRGTLAQADQATRQAFIKSKEGYFESMADLLIADGRLA